MKLSCCLSLLLFCLSLLSARAQTVNDLMVTTALSTNGTDGARWVYVVWDSGNPELFTNRQFSVNVKTGGAAAAGTYVRQAIVGRTTDPRLILSQLTRAACLGENLAQLDAIVRDALAPYGGNVPATRQERLAALISRTEPNVQTQVLPVLRRISPGASMAMGQAWAGPVAAAAGQEVTIELREFDAATQSDRGVVGRTTVTVATHAPLPAPGGPWQVPDLTATGDLNIRLRWSLPEPLLRRQAQLMGFTVWRAPKALAESLNWHLTPPAVSQLTAALGSGVKKLNAVPVRESKIFTAANVTNVTPPAGDAETYFMGDDNDRYLPGGQPFADGDQFYYFSVPHDLLNRPGQVSVAGAGLACRLLPPPVPRELTLTNSTSGGSGAGAGRQVIVLTWKQNVNAGSDQTDEYHVFSAPGAEAFAPGAPALTPLAVLPHTGAATLSFEDATAYPEDQTQWFTVRAVHHGARGDVASVSAPPVPGVRRNMAPAAAPAPGDTFTAGFCPRCVLTPALQTAPVLPAGVEPWTVRVQVTRMSPDVAWVDVEDKTSSAASRATRVFFPDGSDVLNYDFLTVPVGGRPVFDIVVQAAGMEGTRSFPLAIKTGSTGSATTLLTLSMQAAVLDAGQIASTSAMAVPLLGSPVALGAASAVRGGTGLVSAANAAAPSALPDGTDVLVQQGGEDIGVSKVWRQRVVFTGNAGVGYTARPIAVTDPEACARGFHSTRSAGGPRLNAILTGFYAPANTREFRLYRQVDSGELSLVRQGELPASFTPGGADALVALLDSGLPPNSACLNYFVQMLDKSGNGSPLVRLGTCVQATAPLPVPTLGQPAFTGTPAAPKVQLRWTCPSDGVEQFEIYLRPKTGMPMADVPPGSLWQDSRPVSSAVPLRSFAEAKIRHAIYSPRDPASGLPTGQRRERVTAFLSPRTGTGPAALGVGPLFSMEFGITPGVEYEAWIAALGPGNVVRGTRGEFSELITFRYLPPPPPPDPNCVVPWPFRELPPVVTFHPDIRAQRFVPGAGESVSSVMGEVPVWPVDHDAAPVGVKIGKLTAYADGRGGGSVSGAGTPSDPLDDVLLFSSENSNKSIHIKLDDHIYADDSGSPLLPSVLYRQQVANAEFPSVPDTVVQCSPMVTKLAVQNLGSGDVRLRDPFIGVTAVGTRSATDLRSVAGTTASLYLHLLDTKPVLSGARYQYWLVRFQPDGEPAEVVDAGQVDVP